MHANTAFPGSLEVAIISQVFDLCIFAQMGLLRTLLFLRVLCKNSLVASSAFRTVSCGMRGARCTVSLA
jgi:hypothetical protein